MGVLAIKRVFVWTFDGIMFHFCVKIGVDMFGIGEVAFWVLPYSVASIVCVSP